MTQGLLFEIVVVKKNMKSVLKLLSLASIAVIMLSCGSSRRTFGLEEGWEILGEQKVNFVNDKDVVEVRSSSQLTAIRFYVEDKDVRIKDLKIELENGDRLEPALDDVIKAGEQSRVIELGAEGRKLRTIEFKYRSMGSILEGRANVVVTGKRYNPYGY